ILLDLSRVWIMSHPETPVSGPPPDLSNVTFERLDTLVRVTTVQSWVSLVTLFAACAGAVLFALLYRVPRKVVGEGILLIEHDRLSQVRALGSGRMATLRVGLGQCVAPGEEIGEITQEDLKDTIHETEARLAELRDEDRRLTEFETEESRTQDAAIGRLREAI